MTRIGVFDARCIARRGLELLLEEGGLSTVGWGSRDSALMSFAYQPVSVVVVGVSAETENPNSVFEAIHMFTRGWHRPVVAVCDRQSADVRDRLLRAGVQGCVTFESEPGTLMQAIDQVKDGNIYLSDDLGKLPESTHDAATR